jgi:hypothetical protein
MAKDSPKACPGGLGESFHQDLRIPCEETEFAWRSSAQAFNWHCVRICIPTLVISWFEAYRIAMLFCRVSIVAEKG